MLYPAVKGHEVCLCWEVTRPMGDKDFLFSFLILKGGKAQVLCLQQLSLGPTERKAVQTGVAKESVEWKSFGERHEVVAVSFMCWDIHGFLSSRVPGESKPFLKKRQLHYPSGYHSPQISGIPLFLICICFSFLLFGSVFCLFVFRLFFFLFSILHLKPY